ncbi:uncharacterized protein EV420DRAFT_1114331 [Desarmillaria tabescens]|uniref:Uncharacterized protein n=1 Tax=Armillaria tabescens TaxID=1929756 RepID=A0AA39NE23_ARMTA|nr:uncharacterized protein EV420DRAFT_1114331 [Desarmillaria tabescens]KAK0463910.1 hypothetical protein EV420DRAFT_1114331 [Desarmillaria tabescens]
MCTVSIRDTGDYNLASILLMYLSSKICPVVMIRIWLQPYFAQWVTFFCSLYGCIVTVISAMVQCISLTCILFTKLGWQLIFGMPFRRTLLLMSRNIRPPTHTWVPLRRFATIALMKYSPFLRHESLHRSSSSSLFRALII